MLSLDTIPLHRQAGHVSTLRGHQSIVYCLACHPVESILLSGSDDCSFKLWDLRSGGSESVLSVNAHSDPIRSVSFHPSGEGEGDESAAM